MLKSLCFSSLVLSICLVTGSNAQAQFPRYRPPAGPTMPRELDYFRQDVGVLDNYNTFIAPRRQAEQDLRTLEAQEQADTRRTQRSIAQLRNSVAAPTGTGATFMNYSHYYRINSNNNLRVRGSGRR